MHQHYHPESPVEPPSAGIRIGIVAIFLLALIAGIWGPLLYPVSSSPSQYSAEQVPASQELDRYVLAKVLEVTQTGVEPDDVRAETQDARIRFLTGPARGSETVIHHGVVVGIYDNQKVEVGDLAVIYVSASGETFIYDKYRINLLMWAFALFLALTAWFGRTKGLMSILGLVISIVVLIGVVVPAIVRGADPLMACAAAAMAIALTTTYLAHGLSKRTSLALIATLVTLAITTILAIVLIKLGKLYGVGSEDAFNLQLATTIKINLQGLLLGGIMIGSLGVLNDVTTVQVATVDEIKFADPKLSPAELYRRGIAVGTEHIASLTNTLALAYVGASFPILLLFTLNSVHPFWVTLNSETIAEEIIRTLVGSIALVLAVPISTALAAYYLSHRKQR